MADQVGPVLRAAPGQVNQLPDQARAPAAPLIEPPLSVASTFESLSATDGLPQIHFEALQNLAPAAEGTAIDSADDPDHAQFMQLATPDVLDAYNQLPAEQKRVAEAAAIAQIGAAKVSMQQLVQQEFGFDSKTWDQMGELEKAQRFALAAANQVEKPSPTRLEQALAKLPEPPSAVTRQAPQSAANWSQTSQDVRVGLIQTSTAAELHASVSGDWKDSWITLAASAGASSPVHPGQVVADRKLADALTAASNELGLFPDPAATPEDRLKLAKQMISEATGQSTDETNTDATAMAKSFFATSSDPSSGAPSSPQEDAVKPSRVTPEGKTLSTPSLNHLQTSVQVVQQERLLGGSLLFSSDEDVSRVKAAFQQAMKDPSWEGASVSAQAVKLEATALEQQARSGLVLSMPPQKPDKPALALNLDPAWQPGPVAGTFRVRQPDIAA